MADDIVLNKVAIIERCLARVREEYGAGDAPLETDYTRQDAIVLNLQRACEAAIDLAMHAARTRRLGLPQDARDAFTLLEHANVIAPEVAHRMRAMVGFRNVAVHQYQDLSMPILHAILEDRLDDFTAFTHALVS
ncbi:MAG TPA: DUF86 domain-containing protein [Gammaproteobacteria bacterium]|jgi:uncharacterized protein YutE (UPF0331/DUF86 family)|nr:DUF86 domain-containing protein [Gammaproteobacteria bacterium]